MTQATKFYLPFWGKLTRMYPNGKLYSYFTESDTLTPTYKSTGVANTNPLVFDEEGNFDLYINEDITYRFVLFDEDDNLIFDISEISQLNGEPGEPDGPIGPTGPTGKKGAQGNSGGRGEVGLKGQDGNQGDPYLTVLETSTSQTYYVPAGVDSIYITASAGGGSAANYSPYLYIFKKVDLSRAAVGYDCKFLSSVDVPMDVIHTATNQIFYDHYKIGAIGFLPGSGFSGQACYRKKISLNKAQENKISVYPGAGGVKDNLTLQGNPGIDTFIYVNDILTLTLKGGLGGENKFPKIDADIPVLVNGQAISLNRGFSNGLLYFQNSSNPTYTSPLPGYGYSTWTTKYNRRVMVGGVPTSVSTLIETFYYSPVYQISSGDALHNVYPVSNIKDLKGEDNIYDHVYTTYQSEYDITNEMTEVFYKTSVKALRDGKGAGSGGDAYFNYNGNIYYYYMNGYYVDQSFTFTLLDEDAMKTKIINQLLNFTASDSFSPGTTTVPSKNDPTFWTQIAMTKTAISNPTTYINFNGSNFYNTNNLKKVLMATNPNSVGGSGADGYVKIEYGSIIEHVSGE